MSLRIILIALILITVTERAISGHIYSWDVALEYQNAGEAKYITFFFSLESGLPVGNKIMIEFPKEITTGGSLDSCEFGQVGITVTGGCSVTASQNVATVLVLKENIIANQWYRIRLELTNLMAQTVGYQGVISMWTQSSGTKSIKYDSNSVFAFYQFAPKPLATVEVNLTSPKNMTESMKSKLGQSVEYYIDVKPKVSVEGGSIWTFELEGSHFRFAQECYPLDFSCEATQLNCENITLIRGGCSIDAIGKELIFTSWENIVENKRFRLKTVIVNPTYKTSSVGFTVSSESKLTKLLFERRYFATKFSVSDIVISAPILKFLWGVPAFDGTTNSRCKIGFYKSGSNIKVFNNFLLEFRIPATPESRNLKVSFQIPDSNFAVLSGSISTNLPTFPGKALEIKITTTNIEVWNVGPFFDSSTTSYQLRGRCYFPSGATSTSIGAIKVEALNSLGVEISVIGSSSGATYSLITNYEYAGGSKTLAANDYHYGARKDEFGYVFVGSKLGVSTYTVEDTNHLFATCDEETIRPGISLSTASSKLRAILLVINPGPEHICCKDRTNYPCEQANDVSTCGDGSTNFVILLGMVANSDILTLSSTSGLGVEILNGFWGLVAVAANPSCSVSTTVYTH